MLSKKQFLLVIILMLLLAALLFTVVELASLHRLFGGLLNGIASALFGVATISLVNEYFLSDRFHRTFMLLSDQNKTGLQRVLTSEETREYLANLLPKARSIRAFSIAYRWLLEREHERHRMKELIKSGCKMKLLFPDPREEEIRLRINRDEEGLPRFSLETLGANLIKIKTLLAELGDPPDTKIRLYKNYPTVSLIIIDNHMFLSTYLIKSLGIDTLTFYFKMNRTMLEPYLRHIDHVFESDAYSKPLSDFPET